PTAGAIIQVPDAASSVSLSNVSSDPFADLASSTEAFATGFREFMTRNPQPALGSPADSKAQGEPFAGDWADRPSSDIFATAYLSATSCKRIAAPPGDSHSDVHVGHPHTGAAS